jgi:N-glycosylase/DNA lyase
MYEDRKQRSVVMDRLIKMSNIDIVHVCIRFMTSMEYQTAIGPEEFWTRFEKYLSEKESVQLSLQIPEKQSVINPDFTVHGIVEKILLDNPKAI